MSIIDLNQPQIASLIKPTFGGLTIQDNATGASASTISMSNTAVAPNDRTYTWFNTNATAGGLVAGDLHLYSYGSAAPNITELMHAVPTKRIVKTNPGLIDTGRAGKFTGTGSSQALACYTINADSTVLFFLTGTTASGGLASYTAALAAPVATITAGTGFSTTVTSGLIYSYLVLG